MFFNTIKTAVTSQTIMREYIFNATFFITGNALVERRVPGLGMENLKRCVSDDTVFRFMEKGMRI